MDDINKLKDILSRSKAIMAKTDTEFGGVGNISSIDATPAQTYQEKEIPNLTENYINTQQDRSTRSVSPQNGKYRNLKTTKMPKVVVDAMVNTPIEIPESPYASFELDQLGDLVNESTTTQSTPPDSTTTNVDNIRQIVREEIEDIVRDVVEGYLDKALITEDIQIKIGNTVFSGNLKPLPKKRKRRV